jgi:predicted glutamine amidotransferase
MFHSAYYKKLTETLSACGQSLAHLKSDDQMDEYRNIDGFGVGAMMPQDIYEIKEPSPAEHYGI